MPAYAKTYFLILSLALPLAAVSALAFAILFSQVTAQQSVDAQQQSSQTFTAELTVENEVPPVNTQATGVAQFQLSSDGKEINYGNFLPREYYTV